MTWSVVSPQTNIVYHNNTIQTTLSSSEYILLVGSSEYISQNTAHYQEVPTSYNLYQNYPNPFNPATNIRFQIPERQNISLRVYDILGREVTILMKNEPKEAGYYQIKWDGKNKQNNPVASGVYLLHFTSNNYSKTIKMIFQR
jgi:hypothetical protein